MRRTCTHCGIDQVVADDKISTGWNFLKCHSCGGMSVVQGDGFQNLLKLTERPVRIPKPKPALHPEAAPQASIVAPPALIPETLKIPSLPVETAAPIVSIAAENVPTEESPNETAQEATALNKSALKESANPSIAVLRQLPKLKTPKHWASLSLAVICIASGGYLAQTAKKFRAQAELPATPLVSDELSAAAMDAAHTSQAAPVPAGGVAAADAALPISQAAPASPASPEFVEQHTAAVNRSPAIVSRSDVSPANNSRQVQVLANTAVLRSGPGTNFKKIGIARAELRMIVAGSFDNWIEVKTAGEKTAWVRSDLVKPLAQVALQQSPDAEVNHERR